MKIRSKTSSNKKTEVFRFGFFMLLSIFLFSCKKDQLSAMQIVEQSIESHGGLKTWQKAKSLSFTKTTVFYNRDGSIEKEINQKQFFELQPKLKGLIQDLKFPTFIGVNFDGKDFWKTENDSIRKIIDSTELKTARNSFFSAQYVVSQPFALLEENVILKYGGKEELGDKLVYVINVSFSNDTKTSDKWSYYFDVKTYQLLANKVIHKPTVSLIKNLDFNTDTGLMFNAHRKSYFLTTSGDIDYLRAEYFYKDFEVVY